MGHFCDLFYGSLWGPSMFPSKYLHRPLPHCYAAKAYSLLCCSKANMSNPFGTIVWSLLLQCLPWLALVHDVLEHLCIGLLFYAFTKKNSFEKRETLCWWVEGPCVCVGARAHMGNLQCVPKSKHLPHGLDPCGLIMQNQAQMKNRFR